MTSNDPLQRIVLEADLSRKAYFAGDRVEAQISFTFPQAEPQHLLDVEKSKKGEQDHKSEFVEWASIQLHGHLVYDKRVIDLASVLPSSVVEKLADKPDSPVKRQHEPFLASPKSLLRRLSSAEFESKTSQWQEAAATSSIPDFSKFAGNNGFCMFLSEPEIMACELEVSPGSKFHYMFRATLPTTIPPSYRGTSVRHFYLLSVGVKLLTSKRVHVLHVPIRMFPSSKSSIIVDNHRFDAQSYGLKDVVNELSLSTSEPFLQAQLQVHDSDLLGIWKGGFHRDNSTHAYRIGSDTKYMALLTVFKNSAVPGEDLLLTFDFSNASIPCYHVSVSIEVDEEVKLEPPLQLAFVPLTQRERELKPQMHSKRHNNVVIFSSNHVVASCQTFNLIVNVPDDATPDYETELVKVCSYLRFEFVTARRQEEGMEVKVDVPTILLNRDTQICPWRLSMPIVAPCRDSSTVKASDDKASMIMKMSRISTTNNSIRRRVWL